MNECLKKKTLLYNLRSIASISGSFTMWILGSGFWADYNVWEDNAIWIDYGATAN